MRIARSIGGAALLVLVSAAAVHAQGERAQLSLTLGASAGNGGGTAAVGIAGGFQVAPHAGLDIGLLYTPQQKFEPQFGGQPQASGSLSTFGGDVDGRTIAFLASLTTPIDIGRRFQPYARAGGGIANVGYTAQQESGIVTQGAGAAVTTTVTTSSTENVLALTAGGGIEYQFRPRMGIGGDVGYLRLFQSSDSIGKASHSVRVGVRLAYKF